MKSIVVMFPYPSGKGLHAGHWYNYAIIDSYCRYLKYQGEDVFQPFGFDAFGLPTELYAEKVGKSPKEVTEVNIENFKKEIDRMNTNYEMVLSTTDESFKNFSQFIFKKLLKNNLIYKDNREQYFCNSCNTVISKSELSNKKHERCGTPIITKNIEQWFVRTTLYRDRLLKNLKELDYPESTKKQQKEWLLKMEDWSISRQRKWGCPIPIEGVDETLDTFFDSSFYFIVYFVLTDIHASPIDLYVGGKEHATGHLIYARVMTMMLYDLGLIDFEEPFKKVIHQGMILKNGEKMSKSKNNTVNLENYDSDVIRFYLMFLGHYFDGGEWDDSRIKGIKKFINRLKVWFQREGQDSIDLTDFKKTIFDFTEKFKFNKVVSSFMEFYNNNKNKDLDKGTKNEFLELLSIYMPSIKNKIL